MEAQDILICRQLLCELPRLQDRILMWVYRHTDNKPSTTRELSVTVQGPILDGDIFVHDL